jgi:feruloyl esterase
MSFKAFASIVALLPFLSASATYAAKPVLDHADGASCAALSGRAIAPHTVIKSATFAPEGESIGNVQVSVAFCRVVGIITPTSDSRIGFEVWLPPASSWNGEFRGEGSGGSAGAISPGPMREALISGYATMSTDNGHLIDPQDPLGGSSQSWAFHHPEKMIDWGWRALHLSTVAAKAVVRQFYGKASTRNYFIACSAGGHHAIMEATRFPQDYDGMVAGAAPWKWTALMFGHTWNSLPALKDGSALTPESVAILNRGMVAACDELDGVKDGVIADPRRCTVDPMKFQCNQTQNSECLTPLQVDTARRIYAGATQSNGTRLMPGQVRGTELGWPAQMGGSSPGGSSWQFWKLTVFQDPNFDNAHFDFNRDADRALATRVANSTLPKVYDETTDLTAFKARGGKFILFQGWADSTITPLMDVDFYNRIVARYGQTETDKFLRFFLLPGMGHCGGGVGFSHIGGATGAPIKDDADHDMVKALDAWVKKDEAPSAFMGAHINENKQITATRWICRYPLEARYLGHGDTKQGANFACRPPGQLPPQPM